MAPHWAGSTFSRCRPDIFEALYHESYILHSLSSFHLQNVVATLKGVFVSSPHHRLGVSVLTVPALEQSCMRTSCSQPAEEPDAQQCRNFSLLSDAFSFSRCKQLIEGTLRMYIPAYVCVCVCVCIDVQIKESLI